MTNSKNTRRALLISVLTMTLSFIMLIGTTFAWFTDSVTSGKNKIVAGNLDIEVTHTNNNVENEELKDAKLFPVELWEPGVVSYETFTVKNVGSLAFDYMFNLNVADFNTVTVEGTEKSLKDVIKLGILEGSVGEMTREELVAAVKAVEAKEDSIAKNFTSFSGFSFKGNMEEANTEKTFTMVAYWEPTENDNDYNVNGDKTVSKLNGDKNELYIEIIVNVEAKQRAYENDSFGSDYDDVEVWNGSIDNEGLAQNTNAQEKTVYIDTPEQFAAFAQKVNSGNDYLGYTVKLTSDMDLNNISWDPIGDSLSGAYFNGNFDGQGHTIKNLTCESYMAGLFGQSQWKPGSKQLIKNFTVENAKIVANNKQGGAGFSAAVVYGSAGPQTDFEDITVKGDIIVTTDTEAYYMAGIVAGRSWYGSMNNCHVYANEGSYIESKGVNYLNYTAGLAAWHGEGTKVAIQNSSSNIDVRGVYATAGLLGIAQYGNTVENCTVGLNEDGTMRRVNISRILTSGDNQDANDIGGIVGMITDNESKNVCITNCTGMVHFDVDFGNINHDGVIGNNYSGNDSNIIVITDCQIDWTKKQ